MSGMNWADSSSDESENETNIVGHAGLNNGMIAQVSQLIAAYHKYSH